MYVLFITYPTVIVGLKLQQYQVITNDDGTVLEVRGCAPDSEDSICK